MEKIEAIFAMFGRPFQARVAPRPLSDIRRDWDGTTERRIMAQRRAFAREAVRYAAR